MEKEGEEIEIISVVENHDIKLSQCRLCGFKYCSSKLHVYEQHWDKLHGNMHRKQMYDSAVACRLCDRYFPSLTSYRMHLSRSHLEEEKSSEFNAVECLQNHLDVVHSHFNVSETVSATVSATKNLLLSNYDYMPNATCSKCGLVCDNKQKLNDHRRKCSINLSASVAISKIKKETWHNLPSESADRSHDRSAFDGLPGQIKCPETSVQIEVNQLLCPLCKLNVVNLEQLNEHLIERHNYIQCMICFYCSPNPNMVRHVSTAHPNLATLIHSKFFGDNKNDCSQRGKQPPTKIACSICKEKMYSSQCLGHFIKSHSTFKSRSVICECILCECTFKCFTNYRTHWMNNHDGYGQNADVVSISTVRTVDE